MVFAKSIWFKQAFILKNYELVLHAMEKLRDQKAQDSRFLQQ